MLDTSTVYYFCKGLEDCYKEGATSLNENQRAKRAAEVVKSASATVLKRSTEEAIEVSTSQLVSAPNKN